MPAAKKSNRSKRALVAQPARWGDMGADRSQLRRPFSSNKSPQPAGQMAPLTRLGRPRAFRLSLAAGLALGAILIALNPLAPPLIKRTEAGGKGKGGRQGHIIVQNEVKGNPVPVYMPIPIPIPMPVGPPPPPPGSGAGHAKFLQQHGFGRHHDDDGGGHEEGGEGEVKKIYLLQPVPRLQPQPQLKGGGFMGPVQNHIHVNQPDHQSFAPGKHRHAGRLGHNNGGGGGHFQQQQQQQQFSNMEGDMEARPQELHKGGAKSSASEVKILPIVVIPPIAPMPPIQVPTQRASASQRMMFSPQFNNFLVTAGGAGSERARRHNHASRHGRAGGLDSFASDYGGSVGGSVFREHFAASRSRPASSQRNNWQDFGGGGGGGGGGSPDSMHHASSRMSRSRDYDYADLDYDQPARPSAEELAHLVQRRRHFRLAAAAAAAPVQRRHQQAQHFRHEPNRIKSIRDILEAHKAARFDDYEQAINGEPDYSGMSGTSGADESSLASLEARQQHFADLDGSDMTPPSQRAGGGGGGAVRSGGTAFEISLDDLSSQLTAADSNQHGRRAPAPTSIGGGGGGQQDLSALYYERGDLAAQRQPVGGARPLAGEETRADLFDEPADQWRFDSIKSVQHVAAANGTMTSNSTASAGDRARARPGKLGATAAATVALPSARDKLLRHTSG